MIISEERLNEFLGAFPEEFMNLGATEQKISAQIYRLLALGQPVSIDVLADALELQGDDVAKILADWTGLYYDDEGFIISYWGLSLRKMPHRFQVDGVELFTWCAWDSLFIPSILGKTATVVSHDPLTDEEIRITVSPEGIETMLPVNSVTSFMMPETDAIRSNVIKSFCHYLHFFGSKESAMEWIAGNKKSDDLLILSIEEAFDVGLAKNRRQYGDLNQNELLVSK